MSVIETYHITLLVLACGLGLFMAFGIGANDVANAMGTSVGANVLTIKQAILVAMIFEFAGAYLAGGEVTATIRKGIVDTSSITGTPELLVFGMLSALAAAGTWLLIASLAGWPVSTTHSIVGAIVGFAIAGIGMDAVQWGKVGQIVMSWGRVASFSGHDFIFGISQCSEARFKRRRSVSQRQTLCSGVYVCRGRHHGNGYVAQRPKARL